MYAINFKHRQQKLDEQKTKTVKFVTLSFFPAIHSFTIDFDVVSILVFAPERRTFRFVLELLPTMTYSPGQRYLQVMKLMVDCKYVTTDFYYNKMNLYVSNVQ